VAGRYSRFISVGEALDVVRACAAACLPPDGFQLQASHLRNRSGGVLRKPERSQNIYFSSSVLQKFAGQLETVGFTRRLGHGSLFHIGRNPDPTLDGDYPPMDELYERYTSSGYIFRVVVAELPTGTEDTTRVIWHPI
jgi:hypothetical protein